jgi:hypothetical protein
MLLPFPKLGGDEMLSFAAVALDQIIWLLAIPKLEEYFLFLPVIIHDFIEMQHNMHLYAK